MSTLFVEKLTTLDFSYLHPQRGLLGETWWLDAELTGTLDDQGMVLDFGDVKRQLKHHADIHYDHKLIVPMSDLGCHIDTHGEQTALVFQMAQGEHIRYQGPTEALALIDTAAVTPQHIASHFIQSLKPQLPANVQQLALHLYPEATDEPQFHYSHGLRHHDGNCQRIAHGHRSKLEIFRNGRRSAPLEQLWTAQWRDIYIGSRDHLTAAPQHNGQAYHHYAYQASQGDFELELPAHRCYLIDTDSTIENLAQHIADELGEQQPDATFRVRAYEGIAKGAIGCWPDQSASS
jgi:6-pyruvoyl-tetrahydropterin synthase